MYSSLIQQRKKNTRPLYRISVDNTQFVVITKIVNKLGRKGNRFNISKDICGKFTVNIIFTGKVLKVFLVKSGARQTQTALSLLLN
jgi:hypothetical protein